MMGNKFTILDLLKIHDLIYALRQSTTPLNEHIDPLSVDDCWNELDDLVDKLGTTFKDQLYTKENLEKLLGKKIHTFEKVYNEEGVFTGVKIQPVSAVEYIECRMTIHPSSELNNLS